MSMDRRQFLKFSGIASILGAGASVAEATNLITGKQLLPPQVETNKEKLTATPAGPIAGNLIKPVPAPAPTPAPVQ